MIIILNTDFQVQERWKFQSLSKRHYQVEKFNMSFFYWMKPQDEGKYNFQWGVIK